MLYLKAFFQMNVSVMIHQGFIVPTFFFFSLQLSTKLKSVVA